MVNAVGKEEPFCIHCELVKFLGVTVTLVVFKDVLNHVTYGQVPFAVLVPMDVTAPFGSFGQMEGILFLLQGQLVPAGYGETHHLEVGKLVKQILEITFLLSTTGCDCQQSGYHHNSNNRFHIYPFLPFSPDNITPPSIRADPVPDVTDMLSPRNMMAPMRVNTGFKYT